MNQDAIEINQEKTSSDKLAQALERLSLDQIRFIQARQEFSTDKEAAEFIGIKPDTVYQWRHKGYPINEALELMALDGLTTALHIRRRNLVKAMLAKVEGLDSEDEGIRQRVSTEIIEWETGKAGQKIQVTSIDLSRLSDEQLERIADGEDIAGVLATSGKS